MDDTNMKNDEMDAVNDSENRTAHNRADNMNDGQGGMEDDNDDSNENNDDEGAGRATPDQNQ